MEVVAGGVSLARLKQALDDEAAQRGLRCVAVRYVPELALTVCFVELVPSGPWIRVNLDDLRVCREPDLTVLANEVMDQAAKRRGEEEEA